MYDLLLVKTFDRDIEWESIFVYPLKDRFRPTVSKFTKNENAYVHWCMRLFAIAYKETPPEGYTYDLGAIYMHPDNIEWLRWRIYYTRWLGILPVSDTSVPEDTVVVANKPFVVASTVEPLVCSEHLPSKYRRKYCAAHGVTYTRIR